MTTDLLVFRSTNNIPTNRADGVLLLNGAGVAFKASCDAADNGVGLTREAHCTGFNQRHGRSETHAVHMPASRFVIEGNENNSELLEIRNSKCFVFYVSASKQQTNKAFK